MLLFNLGLLFEQGLGLSFHRFLQIYDFLDHEFQILGTGGLHKDLRQPFNHIITITNLLSISTFLYILCKLNGDLSFIQKLAMNVFESFELENKTLVF